MDYYCLLLALKKISTTLWIFYDFFFSFYLFYSFIQPLDQIAKYISGQGIPFPKIEISDEDRENLKECYVFEDADSPQVPTVLFFPLVNDTFKNYKAPGESSVSSNFNKELLAWCALSILYLTSHCYL